MSDIKNTFELTPSAARIMEGLRDTGYDFNTAMADIVDNSIAANATQINVHVNLNPNNTITIYIADNGIGMNLDELKNAMKYGSDARKDPSSLGKFGLGLKTASTAFCRCLSVVSRNSDSGYNKVCWDFDYIAKVNDWELLEKEVDMEEIDLLEETCGKGSGTLVIWEKVDRLMKTYNNELSLKKAHQRIVNSLKFHFSLVYQRFLDSRFSGEKVISIFVNGEKIEPWDPFCASEPKREVLSELEQQVEMPNGDIRSFHISAVLLPRVEDWTSPDAHRNARISNDMEGFYVYRENRLIYHGDWLGIHTSDPHFSLLRIEFSFDHTLDELFNVDIKKSRIILNEDIFDFLKNSFLPAPRRQANDLYRATQAKKVTDGTVDKHQKANTVIDDNASSMENSNIQILDSASGKVQISNPYGSAVGKIRIINSTSENGHRVIVQQKEESTYLWEPCIVNGAHAVYINSAHPFYIKVYSKINNNDLVAAIDYLLWSLSEAELSTWTSEAKDQYQDMRYQTSKALIKLLESLPDPDLDGEI